MKRFPTFLFAPFWLVVLIPCRALSIDEGAPPLPLDPPPTINVPGLQEAIDTTLRNQRKYGRVGDYFRYGEYGHLLGIEDERPGSLFSSSTPTYRPDRSLFRRPVAPLPTTPETMLPRQIGESGGRQPIFTGRSPTLFDRLPPAEQLQRPEGIGENAGRQQWFRDGENTRLPISIPNAAPAGQSAGVPVPNPLPAPGTPPGLATALGTETLSSPPASLPNRQSSPRPNPAADPRQVRAIEERLEASLLGDASIHAMSPIQVTFQAGTATVRGVVASESSRIAVGTVLLRDPLVKQVNNQVSVLSSDPAKRPQPIELKLN